MSTLALPSNLPAYILAKRGQLSATAALFATGLGAGGDFLPFLSLRGKAFRVTINDQEIIAKNEDGDPRSSVTVVMATARATGSKRLYEGNYEGVEHAKAPSCWSDDAVRPHHEVERPRNHDCVSCPLNVFGSKGKGKACSDYKRTVVAFVDAEGNLSAVSGHTYFILDVPAMSGKNLRKHIQILSANGLELPMVITRLRFDTATEYPLLQFEYAGLLSESAFSRVVNAPSDPAVMSAIGTMPQTPHLPAERIEAATPIPAPVPVPPIPQAPQPAPAPKPVPPTPPHDLPEEVTQEWILAADKDALRALALGEKIDVGQRPRLESMRQKLLSHFGYGPTEGVTAPVAAPAAPAASAHVPTAVPAGNPLKASLSAQVDAILAGG